jgi:hypothetical protein
MNTFLRTLPHAMFARGCGYFLHRCPMCNEWFGGHQIAALARKGSIGSVWPEGANGVFGVITCSKCVEAQESTLDPETKRNLERLLAMPGAKGAWPTMSVSFALESGFIIRNPLTDEVCGMPPKHLTSPDDFIFFNRLNRIGLLVVFLFCGVTLLGYANYWANLGIALGWLVCIIGQWGLPVLILRPKLRALHILLSLFNLVVQIVLAIGKATGR